MRSLFPSSLLEFWGEAGIPLPAFGFSSVLLPFFCSFIFSSLCLPLCLSVFFFFLFSQLFCPPCLFPSCVFFLFFSLSGFLPLFPLLSLVCLSPILSFVLCLHWRKTVVAAIAGLSCCRRRKWWLRSTRCHCFNGEEKKLQVLGLN